MDADQHYRLLFQRNVAALYRTTVTGRVLDCNDAFVRILGYSSREEVLQTDAGEFFFTPEDRQDFVEELLHHKSLTNFESVLKRKDGNPVWILENVSLIKDEREQSEPILEGTLIDISQHKKTEQALRASEARSRAMLQAIPDMMFRQTRDGTYVDFNASNEEILAAPADQIIGKNVRDVGLPDSLVQAILERVQVALETGDMQTFEYELRTPRGLGVFEARLVPCQGDEIVSIVRDMTRTRKLEKHLRQSQKMEALGTLAGGIAHDFNNLLMGIQGNVSLMLLDLAPGHPFFEKLKSVEQYVTRGAELTRQLLGFARGGKYVVKPVNLNDVLIDSAEMFGRTRKEIRIAKTLSHDLWSVEVDRGQIEQVLLNVFVNAWQAMPNGGTLHLKTENITLSALEARPFAEQGGAFVRVSITDTGVGMDRETQARIFEPFFSTKEMGRGTGLGLASAYGIIKNHGGGITVYSELGQGTTINVYLPASQKAVDQDKARPKSMVRGNETILFVDDEAMIIDVSSEMLSQLGYRVLTARSGSEAVETLKAHCDAIDLVILDMIMPGMSGADAFVILKEIKPAVKVLLCSGYSLNGNAGKIMEKGCDGFIQKPFDLSLLSSRIRAVLD